jgi:hypothetical protein
MAARPLYVVFMRQIELGPAALALLAAALAPCASLAQTFALDSPAGLKPGNVKLEAVTYMGRKAVRVTAGSAVQGGGGGLVVVSGPEFGDGTLELDMAGKPAAGAPGDARGFVGVAFRMTPDAGKYECFYIRPTNGRAEDQERRNHATQYISIPDFEWFKLRKDSPGKYESYADMVPGEWTKVKVEVHGVKARLYVNGAAQPALIVNDLKLGESKGAVGLWVGVGTEAHFSNLRISR